VEVNLEMEEGAVLVMRVEDEAGHLDREAARGQRLDVDLEKGDGRRVSPRLHAQWARGRVYAVAVPKGVTLHPVLRGARFVVEDDQRRAVAQGRGPGLQIAPGQNGRELIYRVTGVR
jgi:hypothetical protein